MFEFFNIFIILTITICVHCDEDFCVTYDFESGFDEEFSSNICVGSWNLKKYADFEFNPPHELSTAFIAPSSVMSCTNSYTFTMHSGGVMELNVYYSLQSDTDTLQVIVYEVQSNGPDRIVGMRVINSNANAGWNSLRIELAGSNSYKGYFTIFGSASSDSSIMVDSFKYESPLIIEEQFLCTIYDSEPETEDNPIIEEEEEGSADGDFEISSTTEESTTLTTTQEPDQETGCSGCVVYQFSQDFNTLFTSDGVCRYSRNWELKNYSTLQIESPNPDSTSCIVPSTAISSCTSSFVFPISSGGTVEVEMYMQPVILTDQVEVIVYQINEDGSSAIVGRVSASRMYGWNTIKVELTGNGDFNGQITIMGRTSIRSLFAVDNFRYIPPV